MRESNPKKKRRGLTRREFLKTSAAGLAGVGTGFYLSTRPAYGQKPIRITCISIFSGRSAVLGKSVSDALNMWRDEVNAKGGVVKRKVEVKYLDSQGKIEEAVRMAREAAASKEVDLLVESCSSREAFSVKEVSRDLNLLTIATNSKTTELTADPKTFAPFHFRAAAQNLHDMAAGAKYAADFAKKNNWKKWAMIAPDYAYGRENVMFFVRFLKRYYPEAEIVTELWPKLNEPDYTPYINKIMGAKVDAVFTSQWGGDIVALLEQGALYGFSDKVKIFSIDLGDFTAINPLIKAFGKFPQGIFMGTRSNPIVPDTKLNRDWFNAFTKRAGYEPSGWSQQAYAACQFYQNAAEKAKSTEQKAVRDAMEDLEIVSPWGTPPAQKMKMRKRDHTNILYTEAWGKTTDKMPYVADVLTLSWDDIFKVEDEWLKEKGWLK
jgi:branched-chain amino acid transport system substrate-binding protein